LRQTQDDFLLHGSSCGIFDFTKAIAQFGFSLLFIENSSPVDL
jgi:hypothetical protein